jgi:hypothetical protein
LTRAYHSKPYRHKRTPTPVDNNSSTKMFPPGIKSFVKKTRQTATKISPLFTQITLRLRFNDTV